MSTDKQLSEPEQASRTRRAEPITQHIAKNGTVSYWFQADGGTKPDGSRDRRRFTYRTKAEARREDRRITSERAAGTYTRRTAITGDGASAHWPCGRGGPRALPLARGVNRVTVRSARPSSGMVVQSFVDQGMWPRTVIALGERPADTMIDEDADTAKSWTVGEVEAFRESVRDERLFACWLLSCYGLRRSEVLGLRWSQLDGDALRVRRCRVRLRRGNQEGEPDS